MCFCDGAADASVCICRQGPDHHGGERGGGRPGGRDPAPHQPAGDEEAAGAAGAEFTGPGRGPSGGGGQRPGRGGDLAARHAPKQRVGGHAGGHRVGPVNSAPGFTSLSDVAPAHQKTAAKPSRVWTVSCIDNSFDPTLINEVSVKKKSESSNL